METCIIIQSFFIHLYTPCRTCRLFGLVDRGQGNVCKVCIHSQVVVDIVCGISIDRCLIELSGWMVMGIHDRPSS